MKQEQRRAEDAERLLNDPLMVEAFQTIESAIIDRMKLLDVGATDAQRNLIVTLQLLGKVRQHIEQVIVTGKLAAMEPETLRDKVRRLVA